MKIIFDGRGEDIEQHAKFMHAKMLQQYNLPRIEGATRALVPSWCDECGSRAWGPVMGGHALCTTCAKPDKNQAGF
jgi:hypothetical protein